MPDSMQPVNVFSNDPNAKGIALEQVIPPAVQVRFDIPGWTGAGGLFNPGTPEFQAGELYVVLHRTYAVWSKLFGSEYSWQPGSPMLPVIPQAGKDFNAYYDRTALKFFFNEDKKTGETIYTCQSGDVIAHECGHAVLDAHHPDFWDSLLSETGAFHESFGDLSAMFVALDNASIRAAILGENSGDLAKSNAVTRLAEQLARGLYDNGMEKMVDSPDALRDAVNKFKYRDPDKLPGRAAASRLSSESHSFSRVFTGAFYDLLVKIYEQLRKENLNLPADAALAQAREVAGKLLSQGLILMPQGDAAFKSVATALFAANYQLYAGKYFNALRRAFVARRILTSAEARALEASGGTIVAETSALAGTVSGSVGAPSVLGVASVQVGDELPPVIRKALRLGKHDFRLVEEKRRDRTSKVMHYAVTREKELRGKDLGVAEGAIVTMTDGLAVHVSHDGRMVSSHLHRADRGHEKRIRDHVVKLVERERIYADREGKEPNRNELIGRKQPYFVWYDAQGRKRIRRAFIACGSLDRGG